MKEAVKKDNRREFMRVEKEVPVNFTAVSELLEAKVKTRDLSEGGACIEVEQLRDEDLGELLAKRIEFNLKLDLPEAFGNIENTARIVWMKREETSLEDKILMGLKFIDITEEKQNRIKKYLFPPDETKVTKLCFIPKSRDKNYDSEFVAYRRQWLSEKTGAKLEHIGYFSASAEDMEGNIENPTPLPTNEFYIERRKEERICLKNGEMYIKLINYFPVKQELVCPVLDINSLGLSFEFKTECEHLLNNLEGVYFKNIVVSNDMYHKAISGAKVKCCKLIDENKPGIFRIGIEFNIPSFEHSVIRRKLLRNYKIRMPRYAVANHTAILKWEISFFYETENFISKEVINFSEFGIAFAIKRQINLILKENFLLPSFNISLENNLIYVGKANIVCLEKNGDKIIVRCALSGSVDIEKVFFVAKTKMLSEELKTSILAIKETMVIDARFKSEIADIRFFLTRLKSELDEKEKTLNLKKNRDYGFKIILDSFFEIAFKELNRHFFNMWQIVKDFSKDKDKYKLYKDYFQKHLLDLFLGSHFYKWAFVKPLGYVGDYMIIEMIYGKSDSGESLFDKLISRYAYYKKMSVAVRNRLPYLRQKFNSLLEEKTSGELKIMSIGSGSAREIRFLAEENENIDRYNITLIEGDKEAIAYSQRKISEVLIKNKKNMKISYINKAIDQLIKEKDLIGELGKYDLIYSLGLFDYLSLNMAKRLTTRLYEFLNYGGKLIIGNADSVGENQIHMDFILEWNILYRSKAEMMKFINKLDCPRKVYFETENTKTTNFLIIEK
ncbi:MAG: PilZ domain-containing protein [Candidatus Omnitrophota bacterium]